MPTIKIKKSVGKKGKNQDEDAKKVQELLTRHKSAGGFKALTVDGNVGKKTIAAITAFQSKAMGGKADGRVDPGGATIGALNEKPGAVAPSSGGKGSGSEDDGGNSKGKGGSGGSKSKGTGTSKSKGSSKGNGDLKATEDKLKAVGKQYMEAGDRFRAAMEQVAEATEDLAAREAYAGALDSTERQLEVIRRNIPQLLQSMRAAIADDHDKRQQEAAKDLLKSADKAERCVDTLTGNKFANPLRSLGVADCERDMLKQFKEFRDRAGETLRQIVQVDRAEPRIERNIKLMLAALTVARGINATARIGHQAKIALFEKGAEAAEKDMKKVTKEMDRLEKERQRLMKKTA